MTDRLLAGFQIERRALPLLQLGDQLALQVLEAARNRSC